MIKKFLKLFGIFLVFLLAKIIYSQGWYQVIITNSQSSSTPAPFQQDIAICNGSPNVGSGFAYVNNTNIFSEINSNGSNVYFTTTAGGTPNIYSWYEGQENFSGILCDVWWVNLPNGIPANAQVTIFINIGPNNANYYSLYYPYVGEAPQLSSTYGQYDNGNYVFLFYDNFAGTSLNGSKWVAFAGSGGVGVNNGVTAYTSAYSCYTICTDPYSGIITAQGFNPSETIADMYIESVANTIPEISMGTGNSASSGAYFSGPSIGANYNCGSYSGGISGGGAFQWSTPGIVSESWQSSNLQVYAEHYSFTTKSFTNYGLPSLVYYGFGNAYISNSGSITVQWFRVRAYPPNGVMPSFSILFTLVPTVTVNTSTNLQFNVTLFDPFSEYVNYTVYLNGTQIATNTVQLNAFQTLTIPSTIPYLLNQSGTYNLTVVAYGQTSGKTVTATDIFAIQLDQLNATLQSYYYYNNVNYTNLDDSNLNITYYCMLSNNTLTVYDNITGQTLQVALQCNYIETPETALVNLTSILQSNVMNYISGSTLYDTQSFSNIAFEPLQYSINVNLTANIPPVSIYTSPISLNYTVSEEDLFPNVTCNISLYDNGNLVNTTSVILSNSSATYTWPISQIPIYDFLWNLTCVDPAGLTTTHSYSVGPYYYNEFNMYMEDTGNVPANLTYTVSVECTNSTVIYSNSSMSIYSFYLWTNSTCDTIIISQSVQGVSSSEAFSTNLLSNYGFQWPICLIDISLAYYENPLVGSEPYQDTLIAVENPQTGCYLWGSYLNLYQTNEYYASVLMRPGALYSIRVNNTFLTTVQGSEQQAISIDQLIAQLQNQVTSYINVTLTGANVNLTYINSYPELVIQAPYEINSIYIQLYNNSNIVQTYNLTSVNSNIANILITNPPSFNFTENEYAVISVSYTNGLQPVLYYPPYKGYGTIPYIISWIIMLALLYEWFSAYQHYWKILISIFILAGALIIASFFNVAFIPLLLLSGFLVIYLYDFAIKYFVERALGEQPVFKFATIFFKMILVMMFISTILASFNVPGVGPVFTNIQAELQTAQNIQSTLNSIVTNPLSFPVEIVLLTGYLVYGMFESATIINALVSTILGYLAPALGPLAGVISITIAGIIYVAIAVVIIVSLWVILFGLGFVKL